MISILSLGFEAMSLVLLAPCPTSCPTVLLNELLNQRFSSEEAMVFSQKRLNSILSLQAIRLSKGLFKKKKSPTACGVLAVSGFMMRSIVNIQFKRKHGGLNICVNFYLNHTEASAEPITDKPSGHHQKPPKTTQKSDPTLLFVRMLTFP